MRMYWAKQRASLPFSIGWSATLQVGAATFFRPASVIATLMAVGFMSAEPTICSAVTSLLTVFRALMLITSAPTPNAIMSVPAMIPPISRILRPVICSYLPFDLHFPLRYGGTGRSLSRVPSWRHRGNHSTAGSGNGATPSRTTTEPLVRSDDDDS